MRNELIYNIHVFRLGELQNKAADDLEVLKSTMDKWNKDDLEKKCQKLGFAFGSQFDLLKEGWSSGTEALGVICPTKEINEGTEKYTIHPSIIDASFQTMLLLKGNAGKFVPQQITNLTIVDKPDNIEQLFAHTKILEWEENPTATITLMDSHARPVMIIESLATAEISRNKAKISLRTHHFLSVGKSSQVKLTRITTKAFGFFLEMKANLRNVFFSMFQPKKVYTLLICKIQLAKHVMNSPKH